MTETGWVGEGPDGGPALPLAEMLLRNRERAPGDTLETALARSRAAEARELRIAAEQAADPDERAAAMVARGITPGLVGDVAQRLGDTLAELAAEREKIERGQRRQERVLRMHAAGQITALDIARMDFDEGDPGTVARLERRADSLRRQAEQVSAMISPPRPPQLDGDGLEAAASRRGPLTRRSPR